MSKRRVGLFAALIAAVAALLFISSGCGGGVTKSGGLETLDGPAILAKAKAAASTKTSVHIKVTQVSKGTTSVSDVAFSGDASTGTFATETGTFSFTIVGDTIYVRGDDSFAKEFLGPAYTSAIAATIKGKYISGPTTNAYLGSLNQFSDMSGVVNTILSPTGTVTPLGPKTIDGVDTVGIVAKKNGTESGSLYVANDGTDLPVSLVSAATATTTGSVRFDKWGTVPPISAPPADQVIAIASLKLG